MEVNLYDSGNELPEGDTESLSPRALNDKQKLLAIFPAEVWDKILDTLKEVPSQITAGNTTLFFRDLLAAKRTLFLFPQVWDVLYRRFKRGFNRRDLVYPFNFQTTLSCRSVCRLWNTVIDAKYENRQLQLQHRSNSDEDDDLCIRSTILCTIDSVNQFLAKFQGTHTNVRGSRSPFINGRVLVKHYFRFDNTGELYHTFCTALCRLFETFGNHVLYLEIGFVSSRRENTSVLDFYTILQRILTFTPNLLKLQVTHRPAVPAPTPDLANFIAEHPLPPLGDLVVLQNYECPPLIAHQLFHQYYGTVQSLAVEYSKPQYFPEIIESLEGMTWPKLEHLSLEFEDGEQDTGRALPCGCLAVEDQGIQVQEPENHVSIPHLFAVLEQMGGSTLTKLLITLPDDDNESNASLNLPLVNHLTLIWNGGRYPTPLDFLLPMKSTLEMLELRNVKVGKESDETWRELLRREEPRPIHFWKYINAPATSDVWKFPKMRWLKIKEKVGPGEGCKDRCVMKPQYERKQPKK